MGKNILLVEPGYKTKFPPLGLMKISAYHKKLGDTVKFVKGINHDAGYDYWDRVYISTLFTYHWRTTVDTIKYYKRLVRGDSSRIVIGGILASLMPQEIWRETGIMPITGVLSFVDAFGDGTALVVDEMIPDYNLFDGLPQEYSLIDDSYFGYSTRGCIHKCKFCGVHHLEPKFIDYKGIKPYVMEIKRLYGEKRHLVLFDNNILASKRFDQIINDILELGFEAGAKVCYKNKAGRMSYKQRYVDFNQGTDARLFTKHKAKLLSKIAMHPLRIAFDSIKLKERYKRAVVLAAEYGIRHLSNYILYNYKDTTEDFWQRLKTNIDLNREYGLTIYSFPMKYIPLNAKDRSYINKPNWNWYFLRSIQRILNVLKGAVMPREDFFYRAFGESKDEFQVILYMPEQILMYRGAEKKSDEKAWITKFQNLSNGEKKELLMTLCQNRTRQKLVTAYTQTKDRKLKEILEYYIPPKTISGNLSLSFNLE